MKSFMLGLVFLLAVVSLAAALPAQVQTNPQQPPTTITGVKPGQVLITATYLNANGKPVTDTVRVTIVPIAVATIGLLNTFNPPGWIASSTVGKPFCAYAVTRDSAGNILTGRPMQFAILDTSIAKIAPGSICPDTSIDPAKMTANPLPPLQTAMRKR